MSDQEIKAEDLQAIVKADKVARETRAAERIKVILEEERCSMIPVVTIAGNAIQGSIQITAQD